MFGCITLKYIGNDRQFIDQRIEEEEEEEAQGNDHTNDDGEDQNPNRLDPDYGDDAEETIEGELILTRMDKIGHDVDEMKTKLDALGGDIEENQHAMMVDISDIDYNIYDIKHKQDKMAKDIRYIIQNIHSLSKSVKTMLSKLNQK